MTAVGAGIVDRVDRARQPLGFLGALVVGLKVPCVPYLTKPRPFALVVELGGQRLEADFSKVEVRDRVNGVALP